MKVLIDISKQDYELACKHSEVLIGVYAECIKNGKQLPEKYGRLIDADEIANQINALKDNWNSCGNEYESGRYESYDYALDIIKDAPTIIEAEQERE